MSDILEEIQELSNKFSNLFEVDDLGQPAMDVPPSQNKIKRDRKTKDGKVELVSVEDELFPYEGNKREQYRQKILDTINNMIQGTATLEDLLQIVRQKKAPLKEAMELMETALTAIRNSGLPKEKQQELTSKLAKGRAKERELADEKAFKSWAKGDRKQLDVQTVRDPEFTKNANGERKTRLRSHDNNYTKSGGRKIKPEWKQVEDSIKRHEKKAKLAEALSLMEEIINELNADTVNRALNKRTDQDIEADEKDRVNFNNILKIKDRDERAKAYKDFKKKYDERNAIIDKRMDRYEAYVKRHPEILEEALSLMEDIINEVSIGKWKEAAKSSLPKRKENAEIADKATEKAWDEYDKNARKYPEEEPHLYTLAVNNDEANIKAKRRAEHAEDVANVGSKDKASANKVIKAAKKVQDEREDEFGRNPSARTLKRSIEANKAADADPVKSRADEALEEALAIINEVSKKFMAPRLEAGVKKAEQIAKRKEEIIADPKRTEKEKDEAAKENAAYQCKAINVTNNAVKYQEKKQKKNK